MSEWEEEMIDDFYKAIMQRCKQVCSSWHRRRTSSKIRVASCYSFICYTYWRDSFWYLMTSFSNNVSEVRKDEIYDKNEIARNLNLRSKQFMNERCENEGRYYLMSYTKSRSTWTISSTTHYKTTTWCRIFLIRM